MIDIKKAEDCCGCGACAQVCPKSCISMIADNEGFLYPHVNTSDCVQCGLCEEVCNILHPREERAPLKVLAAINRDEKIRKQSSSGGIFHILAEEVINKGGIVFGARFDENWQVVIDWTDKQEGLQAFRGAKYVQSRTGDSFSKAEQFLGSGREVLFSGTHCQIAALRHYLGKDYPKLLTVDCVCHGVPSPLVWDRYLDETVPSGRKSIEAIEFRNKESGWLNYSFKLKSKKGRSIDEIYTANPYMQAFLQNLSLRPSCHECRAKEGRSCADITLGDFWGVDEKRLPGISHGTSLLLVNTPKGLQAIDFEHLLFDQARLEEAIPFNSGLKISQPVHPHRERFFAQLSHTTSLTALIRKELKPPFKQRFRLFKYRLKLLFYKLFPKARSIKR